MKTLSWFSCTALLSCSLLALAPHEASAQSNYDFDEFCAPTSVTSTEARAPDALIILDTSGSMDEKGGEDIDKNSVSKMELAKDAIRELAAAVHKSGTCNNTVRTGCDEVRLGLGRFSDNSTVEVTPGEDTREDVIDKVNGYLPDGGTAVGAAAKSIHDSNALQTADRLGVGILISDGSPNKDAETLDTIEETLYYLCKARADYDVLTFVVGFGIGADPRTNSLFAAAGGTGTCCREDSGNCIPFDPCEAFPKRSGLPRLNVKSPLLAIVVDDMDDKMRQRKLHPDLTCTGAKQANSGQQLKDDLLELLSAAACTFPVDIPNDYVGYPLGPDEPDAVRIEFNHTVFAPAGQPKLRIPPYDPDEPDSAENDPNALYTYLKQRGVSESTAADYKEEGWRYGDAQRRTMVLTETLCGEVFSANVDEVESQAACLCENTDRACNTLCFDEDGDGLHDGDPALYPPDGLDDPNIGASCVLSQCEDEDGDNFDDVTGERCGVFGCRDADEDGYDDNTDRPCGLNNCIDRDEDGNNDRTGEACPSNKYVLAGRCMPGVVECRKGIELCQNTYAIQPDLCNGLDDDCDGDRDNSSRARHKDGSQPYEWDDVPATLEAYGFDETLFCGYIDDSCGCTDGPNAMDNAPDAVHPDQWKNLLEATETQLGSCFCGSALELDQDPSLSPEQPDNEGQGAETGMRCQSAGGDHPAGPGLLLLCGIACLGVRRRRRV